MPRRTWTLTDVARDIYLDALELCPADVPGAKTRDRFRVGFGGDRGWSRLRAKRACGSRGERQQPGQYDGDFFHYFGPPLAGGLGRW